MTIETEADAIEEKYLKRNKKFNRILYSSLIGSTIGLSTAGLAAVNSFLNPYRDTQEARTYRSMKDSLVDLTSQRDSFIQSSGRPEYLPENASKEIDILYGLTNSKEEIFNSLISKVEADIKNMENSPVVQDYNNWNQEHFTVFNSTVYRVACGFGALPVLTGFVILPMLINNIRRARKEIAALER